jgi:hypothetical protein
MKSIYCRIFFHITYMILSNYATLKFLMYSKPNYATDSQIEIDIINRICESVAIFKNFRANNS